MKKIRFKMLVMDVDGTLTDGKIYVSATGECMKAFSVQDGYGIRQILPRYNITPTIITGRCSKSTVIRAEELGISDICQSIENKLECLERLRNKYYLSYDEIAYIGDDLNDLEAMSACGIRACPSNAVEPIKRICSFQCKKSGGEGAVREFIDWLVKE